MLFGNNDHVQELNLWYFLLLVTTNEISCISDATFTQQKLLVPPAIIVIACVLIIIASDSIKLS